jgi:superfamily II DNA or RNA helicase
MYEDFIPAYPLVQNETFYQDIYEKKEFYENRIRSVEYNEVRDFYPYQKNMARFLSTFTLYKSLLLIHGVGTGKSVSAIASIEMLQPEYTVYFLARNKLLLDNFRGEIFKHSARFRDLEKENTEYKNPRSTLLIQNRVYLMTYTRFVNQIRNLTRENVNKNYKKVLIIMDEAHNLIVQKNTDKETEANYFFLHRFLLYLKEKKVIVMTATPMKDQMSEIAPLLNLVLPEDRQMPTGQEFVDRYFRISEKVPVDNTVLEKYVFRDEEAQASFREQIRGYVSFLKPPLSSKIEIRVEENEDVETKILKQIRCYAVIMSGFQNGLYLRAYRQDVGHNKKDVQFYTESTQAGLCVFPTEDNKGTWGGHDFTIDMDELRKGKMDYLMRKIQQEKPVFFREVMRLRKQEDPLDGVEKYSAVYKEIMEKITERTTELSYIYSRYIQGSGVLVLMFLMYMLLDYQWITSIDQLTERVIKNGRPKMIFLNSGVTPETEIQSLLEVFNSRDNCYGKLIRTVITTPISKEGLSLNNIRQIHIVSPSWNYTQIEQAIGRGLRVVSHRDLIELSKKKPVVRIYQYVAVPSDKDDRPDFSESIDVRKMLYSEIKDINIKFMERQLIVSSWDCQLNYLQNCREGIGEDGSRMCEYTGCRYRCEGITQKEPERIDDINYNLYYRNEVVSEIQEKILGLFRTRFVMGLDEITTALREYPLSEINIALTNIIYTPILVENRYGFKNYLKEMSDYYFLTDNLVNEDFVSFWYTENFSITLDTPFEDIVGIMMDNNIPEVLGFLISNVESVPPRNLLLCRNIVDVLPEKYLKIMIESMWVSTRSSYPRFREFLQEHLVGKNRLEIRPDRVVHRLDGTTRILDRTRDLVFVDETKPVVTPDDDERIRVIGRENRIGYYGFMVDDVFKIREIVPDKPGKSDTRGKSCTSYKQPVLYGILYKMRVEIPEDVRSQSFDGLKEELRDPKKANNKRVKNMVPFLREVVGIEDVDGLDEYTRQFLLYMNTLNTIHDLCALVRTEMNRQHLIL